MNIENFDHSLFGDDFIHRLLQLEDHINEQSNSDDTNIIINHYWAYGTYVREMLVKKDSVIVGKMHRYSHICIVLHGEALVYTEHGLMHLKAPFTFKSEAGTKRLFIVIEDLIFQTIHPSLCDNENEIEDFLIVPRSEIDDFRLGLKGN